jgi:cell pole-organizing protein PopZ
MRHAGEPTVEEILESIKKVIARDNHVGAVEQRRQRETQGMVEPERALPERALMVGQDDVLDLAEEDHVLDLAEDEDRDDESDAVESPLLTDTARSSMQESLAALAMLAQPSMPPQIVRSGETSLEGLVRDLLRPALAEWLDKNLPPMVERMVASEIARIVGKKG